MKSILLVCGSDSLFTEEHCIPIVLYLIEFLAEGQSMRPTSHLEQILDIRLRTFSLNIHGVSGTSNLSVVQNAGYPEDVQTR